MKGNETSIIGCYLIQPDVYGDDRGYFMESYNKSQMDKIIGPVEFWQDNLAYSKGKVLRGLHFQKGEHAQAKLVSVVVGAVQDVAVDLRRDSPTYGNVVSVKLTADNHHMLYVPRGCAHGYLTLTDEVIFTYKCDNLYHKESEGGLHYNDNKVSIDWMLPLDDAIISEKDLNLPTWDDVYVYENVKI